MYSRRKKATQECLCGYHNHLTKKCTCSKRALWWFHRKISGPVLDRIDIQLELQPVPVEELAANHKPLEPSATIRQRVINARNIQRQRFMQQPGIHCNTQMEDKDVETFCSMDGDASRYLLNKLKELDYTARAYSRILKLARTIADLAGTPNIQLHHVAEALHFRCLDKQPPEATATKIKTITSSGYPYAV